MMAETEFSTQLEDWLTSDGPKTLGDLSEVFAEKSFAVTILLLMFVPALPLPTGGITHVFEVITVLIALEMVFGRRTIWLPDRFRRRELGNLMTGKALPFVVKRVRFFERHSKPRFARLFANRVFRSLLAIVIIGFTTGAAIAPPFSGLDTLPALGVVIICLSIILEDVLVLLIGLIIGAAGIALIITIGAALARFLRDLIG
jgi:hypothetical protein